MRLFFFGICVSHKLGLKSTSKEKFQKCSQHWWPYPIRYIKRSTFNHLLKFEVHVTFFFPFLCSSLLTSLTLYFIITFCIAYWSIESRTLCLVKIVEVVLEFSYMDFSHLLFILHRNWFIRPDDRDNWFSSVFLHWVYDS